MEILKKLISIYSVSGSEKEILAYIQEYLQKLGLVPTFIGDNLLVKIVGENSKKSLLFNAHVDTVAIGDISAWNTPPLQPFLKQERLYGLGASDEKATIATLLLLAQKYTQEKPDCDVFLMFVSKEEVDGSGTKDVLEYFSRHERLKYEKVAGVLGEPTGLHEIEVAHKGNLFLKVTTTGDSGHASNPDNVNTHAVYEMIEVGRKLERLQKIWAEKYEDSVLGSPSIGLFTSIISGNPESPNKFPDTCTATFDVRTTPLMHDKAYLDFRKCIFPAKVEYLYPEASYGYTNPKEDIVLITKHACKVSVVASTWSNDLCFFTAKNIPAVVLGPGERSVIHKANEYCFVQKMTLCVNLYAKIVKEFATI